MRVILIQPPSPKFGVTAQEVWQLARPLCLFYLAAAVRQSSHHEVEILDFENASFSNTDLQTILDDMGPADVFGITATTFSRFEAQKIARIVRRLHPDAIIIGGGVHFTFAAGDTLDQVSEIDLVVRGDGEVTLVQILESLEQRLGIESIKGISYRSETGVVHNEPQVEFTSPDVTAIYLDYSWDEYPEYLFGSHTRTRAISIMASRGCPFSCAFCAKSESRYCKRTPASVVDEIELLSDRFGITAFNFLDLSFTAEAQYVRDLCNELIRRDLGIEWWCESRANTPPRLVELMSQAGCVSTVVGVESGSPRIVSSISKGISIDQAIRFCTTCRDLGIEVQPYFMYSLPGETREDAELTLDLIERLEEFTLPASFQPCLVFPGTEVERIARSNSLLDPSFSWAAPYHSDVNAELDQLPNIPLFLDRMTLDDLRGLKARRSSQKARLEQAKDHRLIAESVSKLTIPELATKLVRQALAGKPIWRYAFSPSLFSEIARTRRQRRHQSKRSPVIDPSGGK